MSRYCLAAIGAAALVVSVGTTPAAAWDGGVAAHSLSRLRGIDAGARAVLSAGLARSATFRALARTLENSDVIVYIETRPLARSGQLQFVRATNAARYLRVALHVPGREEDLVGWLAHELWHAVEIAQARAVTSQAGLSRFYRSIGTFSLSGTEVETEHARTVQARVVEEWRALRNERNAWTALRSTGDGADRLSTLWPETRGQKLLVELQPKAVRRFSATLARGPVRVHHPPAACPTSARPVARPSM